MLSPNDAVIIGGAILLGVLIRVALVRYGIRVGNRLTIAAQNNEPLDLKKAPLLQEDTE